MRCAYHKLANLVGMTPEAKWEFQDDNDDADVVLVRSGDYLFAYSAERDKLAGLARAFASFQAWREPTRSEFFDRWWAFTADTRGDTTIDCAVRDAVEMEDF